MPHASLSHPTRPTLEFHQGQTDEDRRQAVADIAPELATERKPLVHIRARDRTRTIRGRVSAPRRAANDGTTSDWRQALANYVDLLESHCDEFQGDPGYTFTDDIRSESFNVVVEAVRWTLTQGRPFDFEYEMDLLIGQGVLESKPLDRRNPTVDTGMSVAAKVGGFDLPGMREMRVERSIALDTNALYDASTAENNDIVAEEGPRQQITFRGTHTGTDAARATADSNLQGLIGAGQQTFETAFPGYDLDGFVLGYDSDLESRFGDSKHTYALTFIEGEKA